MRILLLLVLGLLLSRAGIRNQPHGLLPTQPPLPGLVVSTDELQKLPMTGVAWEQLLAVAQEPIDTPQLSDRNDRDNIRTLARALVFARTGEARYRDEVVSACEAVMATAGGTTLALGRELAAYVIAAGLVGLPPALDTTFRDYLKNVRNQTLGGRTLISTHEDRPNNWGTHAGASRIAVARYLGDNADLERAAAVFKGWLGDRETYKGFVYGALSWQSDSASPVGINPKAATISGYDVDGVLPDDQRRGGKFDWPPPHENYVYEALQGAVLQAILLDRAGYDVWEWQDRALLRAFQWLNSVARFPAEGDDRWLPWVINHFYGTSQLPTPASTPGKGFGFGDWLYPSRG